MTEKIQAWHFVGGTLRDGRCMPADGEKLVHKGKLELCETGLHASERLIDALRYAPGHTLCRVELSGRIIESDDKLVASERVILWRIDAEPILFEFSRWAALQVIHLWDAPDVVRRYLETGDEKLRDAARDAARDSAWAAARDAASAAAWAAARDAARESARESAWAAASAAARAAARDSAWAAARDSAWAAASAAARDSAWVAARDAARDAQNEKLIGMVMAVHEAEAVK